MNQIYLDRNQCEQFSLEYFEEDFASLRADIILSSKSSGYDTKHRELLQPFGSQIINIVRIRKDGPGWYTIVKPAVS